MTPQIHYLLELAKLLGRLSHCIAANDTPAFLGILGNIKYITDKTIAKSTPRQPFRYIDDSHFFDVDDDEL